MADDTGRCVNCGFLGKLRRQIDAETFVYEATRYNRETGTLYRYSGWPNPGDIPTQPTCFRNAANLQKELVDALAMAGQKGRAVENEYTLAVIEKTRECESWYPWTEYRNPKDHFEEFKMQQLENDRRQFERKLTQMQIGANAKVSKVGIWIGIAAIILAVAEVLTMTKDAILWKWIANIVSLIQNGVGQ